MRLVSENPVYIKRLGKRVKYKTTWWQRLTGTQDPLQDRISRMLRGVAEDMGSEGVPNITVRVYRDSEDMTEKVKHAWRGPLGFYTAHDKTVHLSAHDADDVVVAHELARAVFDHQTEGKPDSFMSLQKAMKVREKYRT